MGMITAIAFIKRAWPYLVAALFVFWVLSLAYHRGAINERARLTAIHAVELSDRDQATAKALADQAEKSKANLEAAQAISRANLISQQATQDAFLTLSNEVAEYADTNSNVRSCGLDADGLRLWQAANSGGSTAHPAAAGNP